MTFIQWGGVRKHLAMLHSDLHEYLMSNKIVVVKSLLLVLCRIMFL